MKKVVSFVVLVLVMSSIIILTIYTLNNKGVKEDVQGKVGRKIENVTTNMTDNSLNEIYNVYLNNQRHKLKLEYSINKNKENNMISGTLLIYIDGVRIIRENVINDIQAEDIESLFSNVDVDNYVRIDMNNIQILKENNQEYLLIRMGVLDKDKVIEKYYLFDDKGESLIEDGLLIRNDQEYIVNKDGKDLNVFYESFEGQLRVKREGNIFYALILEEKEENLVLNEYKYYFKNDKLNKELITTHENVKIKDKESK